MLIKFDEKYLTISSEITNYAKREEMEKKFSSFAVKVLK